MSTTSPLLVFTDLDGSLLDHHSYSFAAALPALAALAERNVPVIPVSSKTRRELGSLRQSLDNHHPFIVENGAAVFVPVDYFQQQPVDTEMRGDYWVREFAPPRDRWLHLLGELESGYAGEFDYFHRAGPAGIAAMTGLSLEGAEHANCREYSEPVQWCGTPERRAEFVAALTAAGAHALQGGRFLTVAGDCDKGRALTWLRSIYQQAFGTGPIHDLAIGDSGNDVAMLEAAETALVIRSPVNPAPRLQRDRGVIYSRLFGPEGWTEGVERWLAQTANPTNSN